MAQDHSRPVYSTETGRLCPGCGRPADACTCAAGTGKEPAGDGIIRISREVKGRKGKEVTVAAGFQLEADELKQLAKTLKRKCGTGGTVKDNTIEMQGDHRDKLLAELVKLGHEAKLAGG